ncbi:MAG: dihydrolipoamide acetyltransferase family protein [Bacteroidota bacterium]
MAKLEILIPAMGEGITEATITKFLKNIGEKIEDDDAIIEIATDKVDSEITAPKSGILEKLLYNEGDEVAVGEVVAILNTSADISKVEEIKTAPVKTNKIVIENKKVTDEEKTTSSNTLFINRTPEGKFLSPLVRSIANKEGVSVTELERINGTGLDHRITKDDLLIFVKQKTSGTLVNEDKHVSVNTKNSKKGLSRGDSFEVIEMDRMRKLIADHMINSKKTSAHVTSFIEVDVTNIVQWRNKVKDSFLKMYNEKITFTPIFIEATVQAIGDYPMINISVDENKIFLKKNINIGMATALPSGNLIVPVIKSAEELNMLGLTKSVNDLANRARNNKLKPDEIQGGTFTITNLGSFGNITGTPIINQPEVAILAVGAIKKKPAVIETPQGDSIGIRHLMVLSMSYDHRVIDGALGGMFLKRVADILENFDPDRNI